MPNQQLLDYINSQRALGQTEPQIRQALAASGWPEALVNEGFTGGSGQPPGAMPQPPASSVRTDLPKIGQLFSESLALMKERILVMFVSGLLPILGLVGAGVIGGIIWFIFSRFSSLAGNILAFILIIGLFVGYIYAILWMTSSFLVALRDAPEKTGIMENLKRSRKLIWSVFLVSLILQLVMMGGIVLLIVPGIMFMVWYGFGTQVMVTEGKKGRLAAAQSKAYVVGRSWKVFGRILLIYLAYYVPYIALQILNVVFKGNLAVTIPTQILLFCLAFFGIFYILAFTYTLYRHLRDSAGPTDAQKYIGGVTAWTIWGAVGGVLVFLMLFASIVLLALSSARALARDAKRMADVRLMSSAEELYFNENNAYSQNLQNLIPKYISDSIPTTPTPPDGSCTAEQNDYKYTLIDPSHYQITFCLGNPTAGYSPGPHIMTEQGIDGKSDSGSNQLQQPVPFILPANSPSQTY